MLGVEDYKKCLKISVSGNPEKWYLRYAGINMGWIERKMQWEDMTLKYVCTFTPDNVSPEKEPAIFDEKLSSYAVLFQRSDSEVAVCPLCEPEVTDNAIFKRLCNEHYMKHEYGHTER